MVVHGKPSYFFGRGTLSLRVDEVRPVGVGELLARIERLRALLAAEGLFDPARKRRPPRLPRCVGLVTSRASAAEHDVIDGRDGALARGALPHAATPRPRARRRCPRSSTRSAPWTATPRSTSIVLARGGGSVEDLLPFSDEALCRGRRARAARRWSPRSATSPTPRWSTTSPTSAPRRPPTRRSGSCPTSPRRPRTSRSCAAGARRALHALGRARGRRARRAAPPPRARRPARADRGARRRRRRRPRPRPPGRRRRPRRRARPTCATSPPR